MAVEIKTLGVTVPGNVVRKFNGTETTLVIGAEQARVLYEALGTVVQFFEQQKKRDEERAKLDAELGS